MTFILFSWFLLEFWYNILRRGPSVFKNLCKGGTDLKSLKSLRTTASDNCLEENYSFLNKCVIVVQKSIRCRVI